jgi:hypothetical protein
VGALLATATGGGESGAERALVRAGWMPLRFTWHDLTQRPTAVVAEIRAALAAARDRQ